MVGHIEAGTADELVKETGSLSVIDVGIGTADIIAVGFVNGIVDIAGGLASIPYAIFEGVDAAVAVQDGFKDSFGLDITSDGGKWAAENVLMPAGKYVDENVVSPARAYSEETIGIGATAALFATAEAGLEVGALLTGAKGVKPALSGAKKTTRDVGLSTLDKHTNSLKQTGGGGYLDSSDELYDAIRANSLDVSRIAENTGIKAHNIQKVKDHVFYNKHLLDKYVD